MLMLLTGDKLNRDELASLAKKAKGRVKRFVLHWTQGSYNQIYDDYHLNIGEDGAVYQTCTNLWERKKHTQGHIKGYVGIAICAGANARKGNTPQEIFLGDNPPTNAQINSLAWVIAFLCLYTRLGVSYETVITHGEIAIEEGYSVGALGADEGVWDLFWLKDADDPKRFRFGGAMLRELAKQRVSELIGAGLLKFLKPKV